MKIILCYVPVIQKGYLELFSAHQDAEEIYLWGESLICLERSLRKEVRALTPDQAKVALEGLLGRTDIKIAEADSLSEIVSRADILVMPDDAISHNLLKNLLISRGLQSWLFEPIFLRWDSNNATKEVLIQSEKVVSKVELGFLVSQAYAEAGKSSDWWRQVGAVLFDRNRNFYLVAHNSHLPTEYSPYISGDPRGSFSKGVNTGLTTAIHAEAQVIAIAAKSGIRTVGLKMLATTFPCPVCAKLIAACGISELYYLEGYAMADGEKVLKDANVKIIQVV